MVERKVDVRKLAFAHYRAIFFEACERPIIGGHIYSLPQAAKLHYKKFGLLSRPLIGVVKWSVMLIGLMTNKELIWKFSWANAERSRKADAGKSKQSLGVSYRTLQETMVDSFQVLIDNKLVSKK